MHRTFDLLIIISAVFLSFLPLAYGQHKNLADSSDSLKALRSRVVLSLANEMQRLDGEALFVRQNRKTVWKDLVQQLSRAAEEAKNFAELSRVLRRLDQSYPNLHSRLAPGDQLSKDQTSLKFDVEFRGEWLSQNQIKYKISNVSEGKSSRVDLKVGDELIAINGRSMEEWQTENFEFCKFPQKEQCDFILPDSFGQENLSWTRDQKLSFTVKRNEKIWSENIEYKTTSPAGRVPQELHCRKEVGRYKDFDLIYSGNRACIYQLRGDPKTALLRITSFMYSNLESDESIDSVFKEVESLYPWWKTHAIWDHLLIDVIDNYGGNAPIPYYQILFHKPFQEQFVLFKKTKELETADLREGIFWGSQGHEIWFQEFMKFPRWEEHEGNKFTSSTPMFCTDDQKNCAEGLFPVREHDFHGRISILLNQWCVSSCDGFVYNLAEKFGTRAKLFGHPQAADTAYARLRIDLYLEPQSAEGLRTEIKKIYDPMPTEALLSQTVVVSRSVTDTGMTVSGKPVPLHQLVPRTLENNAIWPDEVAREALKGKD